MLLFPSTEWVAAWVELANADRRSASAGAGWDGVVGGVIEADGAAGVGDDLYLRLVGRDGRWYENTLAADAGLVAGTVFTIRAPYSGLEVGDPPAIASRSRASCRDGCGSAVSYPASCAGLMPW